MKLTCMGDLELRYRVEHQGCTTKPWSVLDEKGRPIFYWDDQRPDPMPAVFDTELEALLWVESHSGELVPA